MPDWSKSMKITYKFYKVDPISWQDIELITTVKKCSISNDSAAATMGSASFSLGEVINECYIRVYLEVSQNGKTERFPLGTRLVMTPRVRFNGKSFTVDMDGYTPLIELQEKLPPIGYTVMKDEKILNMSSKLIRENTRAPIAVIEDDNKLYENFVANTDDTWLTYIKDLVAMADHRLDIDEMGNISFAPNQDYEAIQPRAIFNDDNTSILYPDIDSEDDLYGIPNVVEVSCSNASGNRVIRISNDDINSPTSTYNRGREIHYRETSPKISGNPSEEQIKQYAEQLLKQLSTVKKTITFEHGYIPLRIGDTVLLNYKRAGIINVKAVITRQNIECGKACKVQTTAVYTKNLWDANKEVEILEYEELGGEEAATGLLI